MKKTISIQKANLLSLLFVPLLLLLVIPYYYVWGLPKLTEGIGWLGALIFMLVFMMSMLIHELIHAFCFLLFAKNGLKSVKIGFMWKLLTPYAHCKEPLLKKHYMIAVLMPGVVLGVIPILIGFCFNYVYFFVFGLFLTLGAFGDLIIFFLAYKVPGNKKLQDHPTECGFLIVDESLKT